MCVYGVPLEEVTGAVSVAVAAAVDVDVDVVVAAVGDIVPCSVSALASTWAAGGAIREGDSN